MNKAAVMRLCYYLNSLNCIMQESAGEDKGLSQQELAKLLKTSHSAIGRYERDEMIPSIDAVKKMAAILDTIVGYLLGEAKEEKILKDTAMLKRLNDINALPQKDKEHILYTIDGLIKSAKLQAL